MTKSFISAAGSTVTSSDEFANTNLTPQDNSVKQRPLDNGSWKPAAAASHTARFVTLASLILKSEAAEQCESLTELVDDESADNPKDMLTLFLIALGLVKMLKVVYATCKVERRSRLTAARVEREAEPAAVRAQEPAAAQVVAPPAAEAPAAAPIGQAEQEIPVLPDRARNEIAAAPGLFRMFRRVGREATVHTHDCSVRARLGTEPLVIRVCDFCVSLQEQENAGLHIPRTVVRHVRMSRTSCGHFTREVANG